MKDWTAIRERYLRDSVPVRLGGLAANLRRVRSFSSHENNGPLVESLLAESKHFIEWTAGEAEIEKAAELVVLQIQIARWEHRWAAIWADPVQRRQIAEQARIWSDRVLDISGLLNT